MPDETQSRRTFLLSLALIGLSGVARPRGATMHCGRRQVRGTRPHPDPRPGVDGSHVLTAAQLSHARDAAPVFDMVREIPQVADGIRCHCGCADDPAYRSLLSCYEGEGMAQRCTICQGQARLAHRLHAAGKSLDEIRAAIDEQFG